MGEESTTPVYIGRYEDGKVVFEPLAEFKTVDIDITDTNQSDDLIKPVPSIQTIMKQPITLRAFLRKKGLRGFYKAIGMPAYLRTEYLFPKKKKRGTARRKRRMKRAEQRFISFVHAKYGDTMIGTRTTQVFVDEFLIPEPSPIPSISREEYLQKSSFSAPWPGPFEGEENPDE